MIHSILLIGQSNMGGRGFKSEVEPIVNDKILVARNGRWRLYANVSPNKKREHFGLPDLLSLSI